MKETQGNVVARARASLSIILREQVQACSLRKEEGCRDSEVAIL